MAPPVLERLYGAAEVRSLEDTILWLTRNTAAAASLVSMIKNHRLYCHRPRPRHPPRRTTARSACSAKMRHAVQAAVLSQRGDPPEYAHGLLHATYVVVHSAAPPLRADMSLRQEFTQAEVLCQHRSLRVPNHASPKQCEMAQYACRSSPGSLTQWCASRAAAGRMSSATASARYAFLGAALGRRTVAAIDWQTGALTESRTHIEEVLGGIR